MLADLLASYSVKVAIIATVLLFAGVALAIVLDSGKVRYSKKLLFIAIVLVAILPTLFFIGSTIYLNTVSSSGGPVHWHADVEIFACEREVNIKDPKGFSNKIGTATLHEHNDKRIHLEGVVVEEHDASLGSFFSVIEGTINNRVLAVPTNEGVVSFVDGAACPDGTPAYVQAFVYTVKDGVYSQRKLDNPNAYIISPYSQVPDGDCVIIEYGPEKELTERICRSYAVAEEIGKITKGFQPGEASGQEGEQNGN